MTVRATIFLGKSKQNSKETFGLKSSWEPERLPQLREFEDAILDIIQNVIFKNQSKCGGKFQKKLKEDLKKVRNSSTVYVKADKSTNFYKMSKNSYESYLDQTIQKDYKKCEMNDINKLIKEEKKFASELKVADRMDVPAQSEAYINLKDHKPNFRNNPSFRLLNTNKGNLGLISQKILKRINGNLRSNLEMRKE